MLSHDRPLSDIEFVAFDLETTGLFPVVNRIVEFGGPFGFGSMAKCWAPGSSWLIRSARFRQA